MNDTITVLTVTRQRPDLLQRAIHSVSQQEYDGKIQHLILIDGCMDTYAMLDLHHKPSEKLIWFLRVRSPTELSGPEHLAKLRNLMGRMAETQWICFLDDDNEYELNHLRQLVECANKTGSPAVHSWMQILNFDGTPYLKQRWPWCRNDEEGQRRYQELANKGIISAGSNVVKDGINNLPYRCVDTSEWLIDRKLFLNNQMSTHFSYEEWVNNKAEDDKLLMQLLAAKVPIVCNKVVSLKYYLGGYSTNHDGCHTHSQTWEWPDSKPSFANTRI
jgi:glycosyltransferase involved in cell wall biosynthesis